MIERTIFLRHEDNMLRRGHSLATAAFDILNGVATQSGLTGSKSEQRDRCQRGEYSTQKSGSAHGHLRHRFESLLESPTALRFPCFQPAHDDARIEAKQTRTAHHAWSDEHLASQDVSGFINSLPRDSKWNFR
jgi:hypothetical protein